jgi:8-oxo-dGTP pyrophosphatase MutT (NUDIX family)
LESSLAQPLPGPAAQARLAPLPRRQWPQGVDPAHVRAAAGLLLIFPVDRLAHIVLTVRADTLRHGGQVSFPGGVIEPGETFAQAALREAHEEVGLAPDGVRVLGSLTPLDIPVSGFRLHPVVAVRQTRPSLVASDREVAKILEVPVEWLLDPASLSSTERHRLGVPMRVPAFHVDGTEIWGATAMVIAEFLALLGWRESPVE